MEGTLTKDYKPGFVLIRARRPAFTLLEILIAVGVLFIVGSAVVSLSNTLIQGTVNTADSTVTNLWAVEGLEMVAKNRDDRLNSANNLTWLDQARSLEDYGWYYAYLNPETEKVELTRAAINNDPNYLHIKKSEVMALNDSKAILQSEGLSARRLICVEAIGVPSVNETQNTDRLRCNLDRNSNQRYNDGDLQGNRTVGTDCYNNDLYCIMTKPSLNLNNATSTYIPTGNAVKVRSVVVWQTTQGYRTSEMSTIMTNWKAVDH
ncbi:MAG: hypothetical protein HZB70_00255 [Candidatus Berkelbacteria bacterium]|nr:MAG: hypothetical protein HZB70_00255 [Candidatus Berkelbacteria bacterium]QQG51461.1 MAG: hypothetical protein HY845_02745 [Candidatus Berkelbacteria bacterium]